jgi:hypothetical protein
VIKVFYENEGGGGVQFRQRSSDWQRYGRPIGSIGLRCVRLKLLQEMVQANSDKTKPISSALCIDLDNKSTGQFVDNCDCIRLI